MVCGNQIELDAIIQWIYSNGSESETLYAKWKSFLEKYPNQLHGIQKIDLTTNCPTIFDQEGRKLNIDFVENHLNYNKKKSSIKSELISKALGGGKLGLRVLDLSAGLGIDAMFLSQLGYNVTAVERNPLLYLALSTAQEKLSDEAKSEIRFEFDSAKHFVENTNQAFDVIYFDPMFPEKKKSALPRQEMVLFKQLVGADDDAAEVVAAALNSKKAKRLVVKRPLKAPLLFTNPQNQVEGKLVRFDVYGVQV